MEAQRRQADGPEQIGVVVDRLLRGLGIERADAKAPAKVATSVIAGRFRGDAHEGTVTGARTPEWFAPRRRSGTIAVGVSGHGAMADVLGTIRA